MRRRRGDTDLNRENEATIFPRVGRGSFGRAEYLGCIPSPCSKSCLYSPDGHLRSEQTQLAREEGTEQSVHGYSLSRRHSFVAFDLCVPPLLPKSHAYFHLPKQNQTDKTCIANRNFGQAIEKGDLDFHILPPKMRVKYE